MGAVTIAKKVNRNREGTVSGGHLCLQPTGDVTWKFLTHRPEVDISDIFCSFPLFPLVSTIGDDHGSYNQSSSGVERYQSLGQVTANVEPPLQI